MTWLAWLLLLLGGLSRVLLPFLLERRDNPELSWDWRYLWPQLLSFIIFVLLLPLLVDDLASIGALDPQNAWLVGYGAASFGRLAQRGTEVIRG